MIEYVDIMQPETSNFDTWAKFTEEGDSLKITPSIPVFGAIGIMSYSVEMAHEGGSSLEGFFRHSVDSGLNWSEWITLDNSNLRSIGVKENQFLCLEINFIKRGSGNSYFKSIDFQFEYQEPPVPSVYGGMNFSKKCPYWNFTSIQWALNVLNKVYKRGIVPNFIERTEDYVQLWWSIIYPFALRLAWVETFTDLPWDKELLKKYLESRGLIVGKTSDLAELYYLMTHFYSEIAKRGTLSVFDTADTGFRGEFLRLIDANQADECTVGVINSEEQGWILGYSSPTGYQNTDYLVNFRKGYENAISDLTFYPLSNPDKVTLSDGKIIINSPEGFSGIGRETDFAKGVSVSTSCNYWVVVKFTLTQQSQIKFGCVGYDSLGNAIPFENVSTQNEGIGYWTIGTDFVITSSRNTFIEGTFEPGEYLFIGEVRDGKKDYAVQMPGVAIKWDFPENKDISSLMPIFHIQGTAQVSDFHVQLIVDRDIYLSITKEILLFLSNNSNYTEEEIRRIAENTLLPFNLQYNLKLI